MPPNGDFQHLPSWRELSRNGTVATALSLRRHHADTLIVPMSLIRDAYRTEILGGLADAGEDVLHVFLEADAGVLRERLNARVTSPGRDWDQAARELGLTGVDEMVAAATRQPAGTLLLRSDKLTSAELADEVLATAHLRQDHADRKRIRQARTLDSQETEGVASVPNHAAGLGTDGTVQVEARHVLQNSWRGKAISLADRSEPQPRRFLGPALLPPDPLARYWCGTPPNRRVGRPSANVGRGRAMPTPGAEVTGTGAKPSPGLSGQRQSRDAHRAVSGLRTSTRRAWPTAFRVKNAAVGLPRSVFGA